MNQIRYKCDARTKTFLMLWLGFGFNLMAETEWSQIDWKEVEIRVFKLQKRIYRASQSGDMETGGTGVNVGVNILAHQNGLLL